MDWRTWVMCAVVSGIITIAIVAIATAFPVISGLEAGILIVIAALLTIVFSAFAYSAKKAEDRRVGDNITNNIVNNRDIEAGGDAIVLAGINNAGQNVNVANSRGRGRGHHGRNNHRGRGRNRGR